MKIKMSHQELKETLEYRVMDHLCDAIGAGLISPNESDRNLEAANVVDGLFAIARSIHTLANAIEGSGNQVSVSLDSVANTIDGLK